MTDITQTKYPRGTIKRFREFLNEKFQGTNAHRHNQFHQLNAEYGDYLYRQDHEKFMVELAEAIEKKEFSL